MYEEMTPISLARLGPFDSIVRANASKRGSGGIETSTGGRGEDGLIFHCDGSQMIPSILSDAASASMSPPLAEMKWQKRVVRRGVPARMAGRQFSSGLGLVSDFMSREKRHRATLSDPGSNGRVKKVLGRGKRTERPRGIAR